MSKKDLNADVFGRCPTRILTQDGGGGASDVLIRQRVTPLESQFSEFRRSGAPGKNLRVPIKTGAPPATRRAPSLRISVSLGAFLVAGFVACAQADSSPPPSKTIEGVRNVTTVAFSPDGSQIASGGWDNKLQLWDAGTLTKTLEIDLTGSGDLVLDLAFSPDGYQIVTGSRQDGKTGNPTVKVWDPLTGVEALILAGAPSEFCHSVAFSADGSRIAAGCFNQTTAKRTIHLWDAGTGAEVLTIEGFNGPVVFNHDGTRVTGGHGYTQELKLFDTSNGQAGTTIKGESVKGLNDAAFILGGKYVVSGNGNGTLKLWNVVTGEEEKPPFAGHADSISSVAVSADGRFIVSSSVDQTVKLWAATSGQERWSAKGQSGDSSDVAFSPDGKWVVSGGRDGIKLWPTLAQ